MKEVTLTTELVNAVLQYLAGRPYSEVVNLINGIQQQAQQQQQRAEAPPAQE